MIKSFEQACDDMAESYRLSAEHNERMALIYDGEFRQHALEKAAEFRMKAELAMAWKEF